MFEKLYKKIEWVNGSVSKTTPINKDNLNRIENGIDQLDDRVVEIGNTVEDCFQSVSSGKELVASAITDMGVETASDATFAVMAENIRAIVTTGEGATIEDLEWIVKQAESFGYPYWFAYYNRETGKYTLVFFTSQTTAPTFALAPSSVYRNSIKFVLSGSCLEYRNQDIFFIDSYNSYSSYNFTFPFNQLCYFCLPDDLYSHPIHQKITKNEWFIPSPFTYTFKDLYVPIVLEEGEDNVLVFNEPGGSDSYINVYVYKTGYYGIIDKANLKVASNVNDYTVIVGRYGQSSNVSFSELLAPTYWNLKGNGFENFTADTIENVANLIIFNTYDLYDTDGNLICEANCTIEDFI